MRRDKGGDGRGTHRNRRPCIDIGGKGPPRLFSARSLHVTSKEKEAVWSEKNIGSKRQVKIGQLDEGGQKSDRTRENTGEVEIAQSPEGEREREIEIEIK
jgi:hypothetical protein